MSDTNLILTRCPVCRARFGGDETFDEPCRRCGSDLSLVRGAYARARQLRADARRALAAGAPARAVSQARRSVALVDERETRETLAAALAAAGRPGAALEVLGWGPVGSA